MGIWIIFQFGAIIKNTAVSILDLYINVFPCVYAYISRCRTAGQS